MLRPILASLMLATPALAHMDYVTDKALCPLELIDRQEQGMSFDGTYFSEIEYHCEIADPLPSPSGGNLTHITPGFCEEPGALHPTLFVFRTYEEEPGILYVYKGEDGQAQAFSLCDH